MVLQTPAPPLSNIQIELLKHYSVGVSDEVLLEFKKIDVQISYAKTA